MAELPDKSPGEIIDSAHINDIAARSVQRYADAAERTSLIPTPVPGSLSYLEDVGRVEVFDGTRWSLGGGGDMYGRLLLHKGMSVVANTEFPIGEQQYLLNYDSTTEVVSRVLASTYVPSTSDPAVVLAPADPWDGAATFVKQGGVCMVNVSVFRAAVTLDGVWTLISNIPAEFAPTVGTTRFQLSALKTSVPTAEVIAMAQGVIEVGDTLLKIESRIEQCVAMRGVFTYKVAS